MCPTLEIPRPHARMSNIQEEIRGERKGRGSLFIGSELISITPISVLPALLPLSVTQSSESDWLSVQRQPTCPQNKHTHCQFLFILYLSICHLSVSQVLKTSKQMDKGVLQRDILANELQIVLM